MHFILGTAGHIDHGKSSLIQALTGINPDRLPEEQKRGVTIELGFAHLQIGGHEIGVVDVPGHADFVNNMVCGVSTLDMVVFVVAADDGWMPQSEEHLHILSYLGIKNIIIALTKVDICDDVEFSIEMIKEELQGSSLEECPIIPVSSHTGEGLDLLKETVSELAKTIKHDVKGRFPKLYVDRIFSPQGVGTVATGTLAGSELSVGDSLLCYPLMQKTSVRHIQMHNSNSKTASPGSRVGINLSDLSISQRGKEGITRGCTIAPEGMILSKTIDVQIHRMNRSIPGQTATRRPLKNTESVIFHHGTARIKARVILIEGTQLKPGETIYAQLRLEDAAAVCIGDHFIIRDGAQQGTLGGGTVLNALSEPRKFRNSDRAEALKNRQESLTNCRSLMLDELTQQGFLDTRAPIINSPYNRSALNSAVSKLTQEKKAIQKGDYLFEKSWWSNAISTAEKIITDYHKQYPDITSLNLEEFRASLRKEKLATELSGVIEETLLKGEYMKKDQGIYHKLHDLVLPEELLPLQNKIISELEQAKLNPPILVEFLDTPEKLQVMNFLIKNNTVIQLSPKAVLLTSEYNELQAHVIKFLQKQGQATTSEIRQALGLTRKVLIPLLELIDNQKITVRNGDFRVLHETYLK